MKKEEKIIKCLKELNTKLKYQNELVETRLYCSQLKEKRLQERISKAIKYINKFDDISAYYEYIDEDGCNEYFDVDFKKDMLDILKGVDEE